MKKQKSLIIIIIIIMVSMIPFYKVKAINFNIDVQKNRDVTMSGGNMNYSFGLYPNSNNEYTQKTVVFTQDITCNTSMCALEFYTANTCTFETHDNGQGTTTMNVNITAINSELAMNYGYPNCTTNGNTISCLVNNNSRTLGLSLYFGSSNLNTGVTPSMVTNSACKGYIKDTYTIYDVKDSGQQIHQDLDEIKNSDIDSSDKTPADTSAYESTSQTEQDIYDTLFTNAPDPTTVLNFTVDEQSNSWIWSTMQQLIQTNARIIGMFVAILSIGVAKLIMSR